MTISGLSGFVSASQTSSSEQSIINQQAGARSFAQLFQDIQSGDLSAAQQDSGAYEAYTSGQNPSQSDSSSTLLARIDKDLNSQNISGAQSELNVDSFMAGSKGSSIVSTSDTDQSASETVRVAGGDNLTIGISTLSPAMVAAFQVRVDDANHDSAAAQSAQQALQTYMYNTPPGTGTAVMASA